MYRHIVDNRGKKHLKRMDIEDFTIQMKKYAEKKNRYFRFDADALLALFQTYENDPEYNDFDKNVAFFSGFRYFREDQLPELYSDLIRLPNGYIVSDYD